MADMLYRYMPSGPDEVHPPTFVTSTVVDPSGTPVAPNGPHPHPYPPPHPHPYQHQFGPIPLSHEGAGLTPSPERQSLASTAYDPHSNGHANTKTMAAYPPLMESEHDLAHPGNGRPRADTLQSDIHQPGAFKRFLLAYNTPNQLALLGLIAIQAICAMVMIILIYTTINNAIGDLSFQDTFLQAPQLEPIATYVGLFILAFVFEILVALDALQQKNIISVFLLVIFQVAMLVYSAVLPTQLRNGVLGTSADTPFVHAHVEAYAITIPVIIGIITVGMSFLTWKLYEEFNWELFRRVVGPEIRLKRMYLLYQIFVGVLKFDAFFFIGFSIQFLVLVTGTPTGEFAVTIAALPVICLFLFLSALFVKEEFKPGVYACLFVDVAGMAYFVYKLYRVFAPTEAGRYLVARKTLTIFSVISLVFLILTFCLNAICLTNFENGLKDRIPKYAWAGRKTPLSKRRQRKALEEKNKIFSSTNAATPNRESYHADLGASNGLGRSNTRMSLD